MSEENNIIYLTIPKQYEYIYINLLNKLSDLGIDIIKDCSAICGNQNKYTILCWNMFQSAIAAYELGEYEKAKFLMNYIKNQLNISENIDEDIDEDINIDLTKVIIGNINDYSVEEFNDFYIKDLLKLNNKTVQIENHTYYSFVVEQTAEILYILIPIKTAILNKLVYIDSDSNETILYDVDQNINLINELKNIDNYSDDYKCFFKGNNINKSKLKLRITIKVTNL